MSGDKSVSKKYRPTSFNTGLLALRIYVMSMLVVQRIGGGVVLKKLTLKKLGSLKS